jgi:predicted nucleic acid-binding protein
MTNPALLARYGNPALTNVQAWNVYQALLADERIALRSVEPPDIESTWREFALRTTASTRLWTDAYLAAFARAAGCQMVTTDSAFRQFAGLDLLLLGSR